MFEFLESDAWEGLVAIALVFTLGAMVWQRQTMQAQLSEMRQQRQEDQRPMVVVDVRLRKLTRIRIRNVGRSVARDVSVSWKVHPDPPMGDCAEESHAGFPTSLTALVPGEERIFVWGDAHELARESAWLTAGLVYSDSHKNMYEDEFSTRLDDFPHALLDAEVQVQREPAMDALSKQLERLTQSLDRLQSRIVDNRGETPHDGPNLYPGDG